MTHADSLPNDVESLKKLLHAARDQVQSLSAQLHSRNVLIEQMKLQLAQLKRMKFGRSSEQLDAQIAQLELSLEEPEANAAEVPVVTGVPARAATKPVRQALPEQLPRASHVHEPASGTCQCPKCGGALRAMGEDVSEVLEYVRSTGRCIGMCARSTPARAARASCKPVPRLGRSNAATQALDYWLT